MPMIRSPVCKCPSAGEPGAMRTTSAAVRASSPVIDRRLRGTIAANAGLFCNCGTCERTLTPSGPRYTPQRFASSA